MGKCKWLSLPHKEQRYVLWDFWDVEGPDVFTADVLVH